MKISAYIYYVVITAFALVGFTSASDAQRLKSKLVRHQEQIKTSEGHKKVIDKASRELRLQNKHSKADLLDIHSKELSKQIVKENESMADLAAKHDSGAVSRKHTWGISGTYLVTKAKAESQRSDSNSNQTVDHGRLQKQRSRRCC